MIRIFWFALTVLVVGCFFGAAVHWLAHAPVAAAMAAPPTNATTGAEQPAQVLSVSAPVIRVAVAVIIGLFGILSITPLLEEKERD